MFPECMLRVFKKRRALRMLDCKGNVLVYLAYSDRLINASTQNRMTAVPLDGVTLPAK